VDVHGGGFVSTEDQHPAGARVSGDGDLEVRRSESAAAERKPTREVRTSKRHSRQAHEKEGRQRRRRGDSRVPAFQRIRSAEDVEERADGSALVVECGEIDRDALPRQVEGDDQESPVDEQHESWPQPTHRGKVPNRVALDRKSFRPPPRERGERV
jgi:hypothetical protein